VSSKEGDETDGSGSAIRQLLPMLLRTRADLPDDNGVTQPHVGTFETRQSDSQWLTDGSFLVRDVVRELVEPTGRVSVESGKGAVVWRSREEDDSRACVSAWILTKQPDVHSQAL